MKEEALDIDNLAKVPFDEDSNIEINDQEKNDGYSEEDLKREW